MRDWAAWALPFSLAANAFFLSRIFRKLDAFDTTLGGKDGVLSQLAVIRARHDAEDAAGAFGRRAYDHPVS